MATVVSIVAMMVALAATINGVQASTLASDQCGENLTKVLAKFCPNGLNNAESGPSLLLLRDYLFYNLLLHYKHGIVF